MKYKYLYIFFGTSNQEDDEVMKMAEKKNPRWRGEMKRLFQYENKARRRVFPSITQTIKHTQAFLQKDSKSFYLGTMEL